MNRYKVTYQEENPVLKWVVIDTHATRAIGNVYTHSFQDACEDCDNLNLQYELYIERINEKQGGAV